MKPFASHSVVISESSLTFAEITRNDREFRLELFVKMYKTNQPFTLTDGTNVVFKYNAAIEGALRSGNSKLANSIKLEMLDGTKLAFGKLSKTAEFGGGSGSGGGAKLTREAESAQCVYLQAIYDDPKTLFSPDALALAYRKCHVDSTLEDVLGVPDVWKNSSIGIARKLSKSLTKKRYSFHRGSSWVAILESKFKELNRNEKVFGNINKWSPADIYMVAEGAENRYDISGAQTIQYLNNELLKAYAARDIMGVSLKKTTGKVKLSSINYKKPFKSPKFSSLSYGKRNFFNSKDGYVLYVGGEIQFRTFPTFQCEIIGKDAKHGKVSHGGIDSALYATVRKTTENRTELENYIKKDLDGFLDKFYNVYSTAINNPLNRDEFMSNIKKKKFDWLVSKYYVTTIFSMIKGKEQEFMALLYRVAKSESKLSAVHLKAF